MPVKLPGCSNNSVKLYLRASEKKDKNTLRYRNPNINTSCVFLLY